MPRGWAGYVGLEHIEVNWKVIGMKQGRWLTSGPLVALVFWVGFDILIEL